MTALKESDRESVRERVRLRLLEREADELALRECDVVALNVPESDRLRPLAVSGLLSLAVAAPESERLLVSDDALLDADCDREREAVATLLGDGVGRDGVTSSELEAVAMPDALTASVNECERDTDLLRVKDIDWLSLSVEEQESLLESVGLPLAKALADRLTV